jgi:hypothetical protein
VAIIISEDIEKKIGADDHGNVTVKEVHECFANHCGSYAYDNRPQHQTEGKPTPWFVADTNHGRTLKIMFVRRDSDIYLKSAYPATEDVQRIYAKYAK